MKIEVLEESDEKLKIKLNDLTLVNLLNENIWKQRGLDYAAYTVEHPYLAQPVLTVKSKDPKKTLLEAAERIIEDAKELKKKLAAKD